MDKKLEKHLSKERCFLLSGGWKYKICGAYKFAPHLPDRPAPRSTRVVSRGRPESCKAKTEGPEVSSGSWQLPWTPK